MFTLLFLTFSIATYAAYPLDEKDAVVTSVSSTNTTLAPTTLSKAEKKELKKELAAAQKATSGKSKIVAALLAIFLGSLGVHSFYMGQTKKGLIQLGLTLLGAVLLIVGISASVTAASTGVVTYGSTWIIGYLIMLGVSIWALIDFIRILTGGLAPAEGFTD